MKYIEYLSLFLFFFISCKNGKSHNNNNNSIEIVSEIDLRSFLGGERWIEISKKDSKYVNYKRCSSENRYIKIDANNFTENVGQETFHCNIKRIDKVSEREYILNINDGCAYDNSFKVEILDIEKKIVKWSNKLYSFISTSESMLGNYKIVNQPCTDCFSQEECNEDNNLSNSSSKFYKKPQTIVTPKNIWFGEYYFEDGKTGKTILITKKEILYEASGMRYHAKYKLSANQVGDTLGLYYHKDFDGNNNNNLDTYLPLIKLYSKGGKYFIRTVLTNESLKETEIEKF